MTQMGQIKKQLATEAAADARPAAPPETVSPSKPELAVVSAAPAIAPKAQSQMQWRDEIPFELNPGQGIEIKLKMLGGGKAQYSWVVEAGSVNFDTHADGSGKSISYQKGRGDSADEGVLTAAFTGNHGWFWRNRGKEKVKVILRTRGDYSEVKR